MSRSEFSKQVRRDALKRSGGRCEGVGELYGLPFGQRCNTPLAKGWEADHFPIAATEPDCTGLDNCVAVCPTCHGFKTRTYDVPAQAKSKRVRDKHLGIRKAPSLQSRGFAKSAGQRKATTPLTPKFDGDIRASRKAR
jgi:ferredoxin